MPAAPVAAGDRSEHLEPARDRRGEPLLAADVGDEQHVVRRGDLVRAVRAPKLLQHLVGRPGELKRDVQPLARVCEARVGVERDAGRGGVRDDCDALRAPHESVLLRDVDLVLRDAVLCARLPARAAGAVFDEAHLAPRHLGHVFNTKVADDEVKRVGGHVDRVEAPQQLVPNLDRLGHRLGHRAILIEQLEAVCEAAAVARRALRARRRQVLLNQRARNLLRRRDLAVQLTARAVLPLRRLVGLGLAGGQQSDDDALSLPQRLLGLVDRVARLDRVEQLLEEGLVRAPVEAERVGAVAAAHLDALLERRQHVVPQLDGLVVQPLVLLVERALAHLEGAAGEGEHARDKHPARLHVHRQQLHRPHARALDLGREGGEVGEGRAAPPQAEPRHVPKVLDLGGRRGAHVQHPRLRQLLLDAQHHLARLCALAAAVEREVLRAVRLVEADAALEAGGVARGGRPSHQLVDPPLRVLVLRNQRLVGAKHDAVAIIGRVERAVRQLVQRVDVDVGAAEVPKVALGVVVERRGEGDPDGAVAALRHVVEDDRGDLAPLAHTSAISDEEASAGVVGVLLRVALPRVHQRLELRGRQRARVVREPLRVERVVAAPSPAGEERGGQPGAVKHVGRLDRRHRARLDDRLRVGEAVLNLEGPVGAKDGRRGDGGLLLGCLYLEGVRVHRLRRLDDAVLLSLLLLGRRLLCLLLLQRVLLHDLLLRLLPLHHQLLLLLLQHLLPLHQLVLVEFVLEHLGVLVELR
mmetsp:Transcript_3960/g.11739  ORF Transcript_3960/g.11739 Transcript_3960/m.11739 type:complete len:753 (+) Transcript_3960:1445-3703(+)